LTDLVPDIAGRDIAQLVVSVVSAFLVGMEKYTNTPEGSRKFLFGSERTFAFIALLGFVLLKANPFIPFAYTTGLFVIAAFLLVYFFRTTGSGDYYGITTIIIALLVYTFPLMVQIFPIWFSLLIITAVIVLVEIKDKIKEFSQKIYADDFMTLAKFVVLSGVILPLVPDREIIPGIPVSPYKLWLAIVAISAISYLSYILKKFVFPKAGLMLTAVLGGLYSSTATTFILARKSKEKTEAAPHYAAAILSATVLMFLRVYILIVIFNPTLGVNLLPYFIFLFLTSAVVTFFIYRSASKEPSEQAAELNKSNPLELRVALIFGVLYILFSVMTKYTIQYFGHQGLNVLSIIVGLTDIDPFLLNMFQGKDVNVPATMICAATMQAIGSNNILKMIYALILGDKAIRKYVLIGFGIIALSNIAVIFFFV